MKQIIIFLLVFSSSTCFAEQQRELLLPGKLDIGVVGGPIFRYINIVDKNKILVGGFVALLLNKHLYIGGGGGGTARDIGGGYSSTSYGGGVIGTYIQPEKSVHYYLELGIWSGNISGSGQNASLNGAEDFLILEPTAGLAFNIMQYSKLIIGLSYRYVDYVDSAALSSNDLGGISAQGTLVFGTF